MDRLAQLVEQFQALAQRIPGENEPSQPWQDEVVEAVHVHRDVKPSNILLRDLDHAVLGDFGIVHDPDATDLTSTNEVVGARWFMPPEAEDGRVGEPPPNFDVYSLGKVAWTLLSGGARRFIREGFRDKRFNLVGLLGRAELESVNRLLDMMIVADPAGRFESMGAVVARVDRVLLETFGARDPGLCRVCHAGHYESKGHFRPGNSGPILADHETCPVCGDLRLFRADLRTAWETRERTRWGSDELPTPYFDGDERTTMAHLLEDPPDPEPPPAPVPNGPADPAGRGH